VIRPVKRPYDGLVDVINIFYNSLDPLAGDSRVVLYRALQAFEDCAHAACPVEVFHVMVAHGLDGCYVRGLAADGVEQLQRQLYPCLARYGEQVKDGIRRAAERHVHAYRVLEGGPCHYLSRGDILSNELHYALAAVKGYPALIGGGGKGGAAPRQAHAHDLGQAVHGVGGIQALTAACPGARPGLASVELLLRYLSGAVTPHRLEGVPDKGCPLAPVPACHHRPSRDDYGGYVEAGRGHQHSRGYLVAIGEQHEAVKGVPLRDGLHHVGYQLPCGKRVMHALVPHGDAVAYAWQAEEHGVAPAGMHAFFDEPFKVPHPDMSGYEV